MEESILISIKKLLGIHEDDENFDTDIIIHINSVLFVLCQLGVGPIKAFSINDESETWEDFLGEGYPEFELVKTYIYLKVKTIFDPPSNSAVLTAIQNQINEFEWRLNSKADY